MFGEGSVFWMLAIAWVRVLRVVRISLSSADGEGASGAGVFLLCASEHVHQETCHLLFCTRTSSCELMRARMSEKVDKSTSNLESKKS